MGKSLTEDSTSNLKTQRVWLWGQNSQSIALILNFAVRNQPIDISWLLGSLVHTELIFFPISYPLWAILVPRGSANDRERQDARQPEAIPGDESIELAIDRYRQVLIQNPWLETFPLFIKDVTPSYDDGKWSIRERDNNYLPLEGDSTAVTSASKGIEEAMIKKNWSETSPDQYINITCLQYITHLYRNISAWSKYCC